MHIFNNSEAALKIAFGAVSVVAIISGIMFRVSNDLDFEWTLWMDRDLYRAFFLSEEFQVLGSELQQGGRVPGGFFYYFLWILFAIGETPEFFYTVVIVLDLLAMAIFAYTVFRIGNVSQSLVATAFYALTILRGQVFEIIWNPSFLPIFAALIFLCCTKLIFEKKAWALPVAVFVASLALQIHLSFIYALILLAFLAFYFRNFISNKHLFYSMLLFIITLFPFFITVLQDSSILNVFLFENKAHSALHDKTTFWEKSQGGVLAILTALTSIQPYWIAKLPEYLSDPKSNLIVIGAILKQTGPGFLFCLCSWFILVNRPRRISRFITFDRENENKRFLTALIIASALTILLHSLVSDDLRIRYTIWIVPFGCYFLAVFIEGFLSSFLRLQTVLLKVICVAVLLVGYGGFVHSYARTVRIDPTIPVKITYADIKEIFDVGTTEFGFAKNGLSYRVVGFARAQSGEWDRFFANGNAFMEVVWPTGTTGNDETSCLAVLNRRSIGRDAKLDDLQAAFKRYGLNAGDFEVRKQAHKTQFSYFSYHMKNGNCLHSLTDGYILSPLEKEAESIAHAFRDGQSVREIVSDRAGITVIADLYPEYGVVVRLDIIGTERTRHVLLTSNDLRRYDTFGMSSLTGSKFVFVAQSSGARFESVLWKGKLGNGFSNVALSPWRSDAVELEPGLYDLHLEATKFAALGRETGTLNILVLRNLKID